MLKSTFADKLTDIAVQQLAQGLEAKKKPMDVITEICNLYNNKTIEIAGEIMNIPFPILAGQVDLLYSKIDNAPDLTFRIPNKKSLSDKVQAAWVQEMSSTRAGWKRKDRAEKKMAILSGRGVAKVYASSVGNKYQSHYDVVDIYAFVVDPTRGFLEDGNYHGETDIFKTKKSLDDGAKLGIYSAEQVAKLGAAKETIKDGNPQVVANRFDRLKALGVDVETTSFAGQEGFNMTEWIMKYEGVWYYLLFDPARKIWVRADELKNVFANGKTPYISWATHYDEYNFWSKGPAHDVYPIAEAIRLTLNNALENEKRRSRPMRIIDAGALIDVNELQDYVPDNVILRNAGKDPNIVTVETPEVSASINIVEFLDAMIQNKSGVSEPGITETNAKVGVYYGRLQQEADRIGIINKEYSESYAHKGYRFFWGIKQHLTKDKQIEMLGKGGIRLQTLSQFELKDVDDVDDVIVSGGSLEAENSAVDAERKSKALFELTGAYGQNLNPEWVIRTTLKLADFEEDEIERALDMQSTLNRVAIEYADQAIQEILLGGTPDLVMSADKSFADRILTYIREEMNYIKLDKNGNETGIDAEMKKQSDRLLAYVLAHQKLIIENESRKMSRMQMPEGGDGVQLPEMTQGDARAQLTQPNEPVAGTMQGTAQMSQRVTQALS